MITKKRFGRFCSLTAILAWYVPKWTEGNHEYSTTNSKHFSQHSNQTSLNISQKHYHFKELAWSETFYKKNMILQSATVVHAM
jgi:hypothetical protein